MSDLPKTRGELQEAVDLAEVWLRVDRSRHYGLVRGGPKIDTNRCLRILQAAAEMRVYPSANCVDRWAAVLCAAHSIIAAQSSNPEVVAP